jgi:AI-2 transport protein TqsA
MMTGAIIQPRVVGPAVSLSQTLTFFSVLLWAALIGPVGAVPLTLLVKTLLVDANPDAHWLRPVLGPTTETRDILKSEEAAAKTARKSKRAEAIPPAGTARRGARPRPGSAPSTPSNS